MMTETCNLIATSLPSLSAVEEIYFGPDGLASSGNTNLLTVECSTVAPDFARRITQTMYNNRKTAIEASVIGVGQDAQAGNLFFLVSGEEDAVARAGSFLDAAGRGKLYIGRSGSAAIVKLLNNAIGAVTLSAIAEAMALARECSIDPAILVEAISEGKGDGYSTIFERNASHMAKWRESERPFNSIRLKDANELSKLIGGREEAVPQLSGMIAFYRAALSNTERAAAERLAQVAEERLASTPITTETR
jgi:3-hydroxyisobutyrate dehydrogenase-like beta-hydroxyacid dehydrogenase